MPDDTTNSNTEQTNQTNTTETTNTSESSTTTNATTTTTTTTTAATSTDNFKVGERAVQIAREDYVGKYYYQLGAPEDLSDGGCDCGLFTMLVFREAGYELGSREADAQYINLRDAGAKMFDNADAAELGDMVFYMGTYTTDTYENNGITHVGICTGNGMQIDCGSSEGVSERPISTFDYLWEDHYNHIGGYTFARLPGNLKALPRNAKQKTAKIMISKVSDKGFKFVSLGADTVKVIKLPEGKTYCEPVYPDYITVSDTTPAWSLAKAVEDKNKT